MLVRVMGILLCMTMTGGCSQGWSVSGIQITPQDTVSNTVFIEVMGIDSVVHYYHGRIYAESNWCWKHGQFEDVVK